MPLIPLYKKVTGEALAKMVACLKNIRCFGSVNTKETVAHEPRNQELL